MESLEERTLLSIIYSQTLDSNPSWTVGGEWAFGHPTGSGGASRGYHDPSNGYTGSNVYGVNLTLKWEDRIRNHANEFQDPAQEYRVEVRTPDNQVLATVFSTNPGDPLLMDWTERSADLSPYAGQAVRIAFVVEPDNYSLNVHLDDVRTLVGVGSPIAYTVTVGGSQVVAGEDFGNHAVATPRIAFGSYRNSNYDIYVMNADGSGQTRLTTDAAIESKPAWQPTLVAATISGVKWNDLDGDGVRDLGEPGLADWKVYLDENSNGTFDTQSVSLDPDDYSLGTVLNQVIAGAQLSVVGTGVTNPNVVAYSTSPASTGSQVFASESSGPMWNDATVRLRIDFAEVVSDVSIEFVSVSTPSRGRLEAYDQAGRLLGTYTTASLSYGSWETMTFDCGMPSLPM